MKRISVIIAIISILSCQFSFGQEVDTNDIAKDRKHEVSISLNPVIDALNFDDGSFSSPFYVGYKYRLNKVRLRASIAIGSSSTTSLNQHYKVTDTTLISTQTIRNYSNQNLRLGIEFNKSNKYIEWVFAADLLLGRESQDNTYLESYYTILDNGDLWSQNIFSNGDPSNLITNNYWRIGISPVVGINAKISKRTTVGLLSPIDFFYSIAESGNSESNQSNYFEFNTSLYVMLSINF